MTIEEATNKCKQLEKINIDIWFASIDTVKMHLKKMYKNLAKEIVSNGFRLKKTRIYNETYKMKVPCIKPIPFKKPNIISIVSNRPESSKYIGDCTTRCISFCTSEDYNTIQTEQFKNANEMNMSWKTRLVWRKSLIKRGFVELDLPRKVTRATFLKLFKDSGIDSGIIATLSAYHIAAIDMAQKKILDTWDSSGGRIFKIYVPKNQEEIYTKKINAILG